MLSKWGKHGKEGRKEGKKGVYHLLIRIVKNHVGYRHYSPGILSQK